MKLTKADRIVGAGFIKSVKSIDSVLDSNYGGFKYRRNK